MNTIDQSTENSEKSGARRRFLGFIIMCAVTIATAALLWHFHRQYYPYGMRTGKLSTFMGVLAAYARDNQGWYPDGGATPLQSLQKLYPKYAAEELAGMSGSERKTRIYLEEGKMLDPSVSSWEYFPGFRDDDDPEICIIWESRQGIFINGSRSDGHATGFADGTFQQIPSKDWASFLRTQEELRHKVLSERRRNADLRR